MINQSLPLSATIMPYVFSACRITRSSRGKWLISMSAFNRSRRPIGGRFGSLDELAQCVAGLM